MTETKPCPICKTECTIQIYDTTYNVTCLVCGEYKIEQDAAEMDLPNRNDHYIISAVTRNYFEQHQKTKKIFTITDDMIENDTKFQAEFVSKAPKGVLDKASLFLRYIAENSNEKPSTSIEITIENDYPLVFCKDKEELCFYINYLVQRGLIKSQNVNPDLVRLQDVPHKYAISLTFDGWVEVEKLQRPNHESKQAFVAMWFDNQMDEPFEKGVLPLGDENDKDYTGFKMLRIDQKHFNDKICDNIIAEIKQSRFMIADCTELRSAVFFEAGYAMGMGLPVIFTCREGTDIKKCFDTDHYKHIVWKDAVDLKNKLKDRILATIKKVNW